MVFYCTLQIIYGDDNRLITFINSILLNLENHIYAGLSCRDNDSTANTIKVGATTNEVVVIVEVSRTSHDREVDRQVGARSNGASKGIDESSSVVLICLSRGKGEADFAVRYSTLSKDNVHTSFVSIEHLITS